MRLLGPSGGCIARAWVSFLAALVVQVGRGPAARKAGVVVEGLIIPIEDVKFIRDLIN